MAIAEYVLEKETVEEFSMRKLEEVADLRWKLETQKESTENEEEYLLYEGIINGLERAITILGT